MENTKKLEPLADKWRAFGWYVIEVDGNNHKSIKKGFKEAVDYNKGSVMMIAHTVKGKGISFMENNILWHYRYPHAGG